MHAGMDIVKPLLAEAGVAARGTVAIGTVNGDLHDIGKNLVAMMLEGGGFEVLDLEVDVTPEKFGGLRRRTGRSGHRAIRAAHHHHAVHEGHSSTRWPKPACAAM